MSPRWYLFHCVLLTLCYICDILMNQCWHMCYVISLYLFYFFLRNLYVVMNQCWHIWYGYFWLFIFLFLSCMSFWIDACVYIMLYLFIISIFYIIILRQHASMMAYMLCNIFYHFYFLRNLYHVCKLIIFIISILLHHLYLCGS